jgi:cation diffusion facilitator CzcD-associated flavoprotein CzcO
MAGTVRDVRVLIVGAGFAGIGMAAALRARGEGDFVVVERGADVGGTWRDNTYPGATCDVPSHLYSFSWALNPNWTRSFSPQPEIWAYLREVARRKDVYSRCVFGTELQTARWDAAAARWSIVTSTGDYTARFLVVATGALSEPATPDLPGLRGFTGATFHSARWNHDLDLTGRRVAVVGTGASAIQFVPRIAPVVAHLDVYQRTPPWVVARTDRAIGGRERWVYQHVPGAQRAARAGIYWGRELLVLGFAKKPALNLVLQRLALRHLRRQVADPALRAALTPSYRFGCKRVLISDDWYPTLQKPNVSLVTEPISAFEPDAVRTDDGMRHPADVLVFGTGFHATDAPIANRICDASGTSLANRWSGGAAAHRGTAVAGFPNLFFIVGPNTGLGHTSMIVMIEAQVSYIGNALAAMENAGLVALEPRAEAQQRYNADVQRKLARSVWNTGACRSWYLNAAGRNTAIWPDFSFRFRRTTRRFDMDEYRTLVDLDTSGRP